ncbi:hypothetical protein [Candidatus Accumulibacter sp. ACC007]|uniref:hypothetical protein n=1 Tax=Candidatus Accumulibacter sp. ACC007 TaxID=2823333 RepID=UPI0025C25BFE|nr:hypothetical protein [Candidatus Accumulibacter sp. ACC007]
MNPLRIDGTPGPDTRDAVRDVLTFMADAFYAIASADDVTGSKDATIGAGHIMAMCADALREADEDENT